jgi:hypothetical protein
MIALPIEPTPSADLARIPELCRRLLDLTQSSEQSHRWRRERHSAKRILRATHRPGYLRSCLDDIGAGPECQEARSPRGGYFRRVAATGR